jgi:hypothetical protein
VLVDSPLPLGPDESTPPAPMTSVPTPARGMPLVEPAVQWLPGDDVDDPDDDRDDREDGARPAAGLAGEQR